MTKNYSVTSEVISAYAMDLIQPEDETLKRARNHLIEEGLPNGATVHAMDGRHLEVLARACQPERIVEIGTLGGYSTICLARALAEGGMVYSFEINEDNAKVARENLRQAGKLDSVKIILGNALENLVKIESQGPFDVVFIDADKAAYPKYLEWAEKNVRVGGMVIGDNTFYFDKITLNEFGSDAQKESVLAMRAFNARLAQNPNFRSTIFPTGEGLTVGIRIQ